jgi:hypothetical protein
LKNRSGQLVANNYLITFEDASNGDYQDYMFVISNVTAAGTGALPITLSAFEAQRSNAQEVKITWETLMEKNNKIFEIQQSENNQDFETIASKDGAGNSSTLRKYEVMLKNEKSAYYRIKQIDFDGQYTYYSSKFVGSSEKKNRLNIYPNPTTNSITLDIEVSASEMLELRLYNAQGKEILTLRNNLSSIQNLLNSKLETLASGQYILKMNTSKEAFAKKFVKH